MGAGGGRRLRIEQDIPQTRKRHASFVGVGHALADLTLTTVRPTRRCRSLSIAIGKIVIESQRKVQGTINFLHFGIG